MAYNRLVTFRLRAKEAMSDIDVQAKRRYDLIPNLLETVKGYAKHEKELLENITQARAQLVGMKGTALEKDKVESALSGTLKSLFAVAENYPELKANQNFLSLQGELADTENKMMAARRFYNMTVTDLNAAILSFPNNLVANAFGFKEEGFFKIASEAESAPVQVKF
jgi:LemA protein